MSRSTLMAVVVSITLVLGAGAHAGIADWPLPVLAAGKPTLHLYSVAGVGGGGYLLGAYFMCTSTDAAPMQVGVEVFAAGGGCSSPPGCAPINDGVASSLTVDPGATVTFGTASAAGLIIHSDLAALIGTPGSARILSTSKKLICTAFLADRLSAPPTSMVHLDVVSKLKQKGD